MIGNISHDIFKFFKIYRSIVVLIVIAHNCLGNFIAIVSAVHKFLFLLFFVLFLGIKMIKDTLHDWSHFLKVEFSVLVHIQALDQLLKEHVINAVESKFLCKECEKVSKFICADIAILVLICCLK